jgi:hypothetical protein
MSSISRKPKTIVDTLRKTENMFKDFGNIDKIKTDKAFNEIIVNYEIMPDDLKKELNNKKSSLFIALSKDQKVAINKKINESKPESKPKPPIDTVVETPVAVLENELKNTGIKFKRPYVCFASEDGTSYECNVLDKSQLSELNSDGKGILKNAWANSEITGGSAFLNDNSTILQAPFSPSLDKANSYQSNIVGGKSKSKKRTMKNKYKNKKSKKNYRK